MRTPRQFLRDLTRPAVQRMADDFTGFEPGSFDLVVLNSVVQYVPSEAYLRTVLERAARVVAPT